MNGFAKLLFLIPLIASGKVVPADPAVLESVRAEQDAPLGLDPASPFWKLSQPVYMEKDRFGKAVPNYRTEVRTRWTKNNLYFLFICPYEELYLKPSPDTQKETNELWNWDVAEVFIGSDFSNIKRYKEFEMSPQGEWIDLDIDLSKPHHEEGWTWNSGFEVKVRIDPATHTWYGAMRIPMAAIDARPAATGNTMRMNLFRSQGPPSRRQEVTWQAPMNDSFHVPERFGLLQLVEKNR
ncbi:MAG TPA: carbohydrate-binding family 9-like protein [Candidatus Sulfotelmatobacter sp.]|nr:carbohydrate-binding family 9-like protein [Candidatus Sulfotelmatobacter sp.]